MTGQATIARVTTGRGMTDQDMTAPATTGLAIIMTTITSNNTADVSSNFHFNDKKIISVIQTLVVWFYDYIIILTYPITSYGDLMACLCRYLISAVMKLIKFGPLIGRKSKSCTGLGTNVQKANIMNSLWGNTHSDICLYNTGGSLDMPKTFDLIHCSKFNSLQILLHLV